MRMVESTETSRRTRGLHLPTLLGVAGSILLAVASDLPGSPYGPHAGGLWPFAGKGPAPGWEGPKVPEWTMVARNQSAGVSPGRLLATVAAVVGVGLLVLAWVLLWRTVHGAGQRGLRRIGWVVAAWIGPLMFAAPLATQDVWTYGAEGKMVLDGFGGYRPATMLVHSVWTSGVDPKWLQLPSPYGPVALDLSAFFVKISGGRPWVAAECWRVMAVVGLMLCGWGVARIVSTRGGNPTAAVVAAVANPAMLIMLVGGIHNDALMLGLTVSGIALALSGRRLWGLVLCALGAAVKPNALLMVGALSWWVWGIRWRDRTKGILVAAAIVAAVLAVAGLEVSGGFGWFGAGLFSGTVVGPWSFAAQIFHTKSGWPLEAVEFVGFALAIAFVIGPRRPGAWIAGLGWGSVALALSVPRPEPWYLTWAVVLLASAGLHRHSERVGLVVVSAMMVGSILPLQLLWWFEGLFGLGWLGLVSARAIRREHQTSSPREKDPPRLGMEDDDRSSSELATATPPGA
jgi:alpha-1,6-mannosyltransferase